MALTKEEADSIIEVVNERATELRQLINTLASIIAIILPAAEGLGLVDLTPFGEGDDEWIIDDDWEMGEDFTCGDGSVIEYSLFDDGYKNCRDGSDEPDEPIIIHPINNNTTVVIEPPNNNTNNETVEEDCAAIMYDAYILDHNGTNLTITWDADISCEEQPYNLTVVWTVYDNATGNFTEQNEVTYETQGSAWDYVNITLVNVTEGVYDIHSTFGLGGEWTRGTDWYGMRVNND